MHKNVHSRTIHSNQNVDTTQLYINWWTDKMQYIYTMDYMIQPYKEMKYGYTLHHKWTLNTSCMKEARHKRPHIIWFHLYEISRIGKFIETEIESKIVVARGWRREKWRVTVLMDTCFLSSQSDENVLELEWW